MKCVSCQNRFYIGEPASQVTVVRYCPFCGSTNIVAEEVKSEFKRKCD